MLSGDDSHRSLFQQAIRRINAIGDQNQCSVKDALFKLGSTLIVTNEEHRFLVLDQLRELKDIHATLLLEPTGRNTAPALTLAAFQVIDVCTTLESKESSESIDPILVITPADQTIQDQTAFIKALQDCNMLVNADTNKKTIAILGIAPTAPETGYGYIKYYAKQGNHSEYAVEHFVEKPDTRTAQAYLADGNYLWNSGMFVMRASTWLAALKEFRQDILGATETAWIARTTDEVGQAVFIRPDKEIFQSISGEFIDCAVIERCSESNKFTVKMVNSMQAGII